MVRMVLAFAIALLITLICYPIAIPFLHKVRFGQTVREEGPQSHKVKNGTPTMGGVVFIFASLVAGICMQPQALKSKSLWIIILAYVGYAIIGFIDDFIIVVKKNNEGLKARYKFLMQSVLAVVFYLLYKNVTNSYIIIPFTHIMFDLKWLYVVMIFFMFTGTSNAVNLSDGLDGLCAGLTIFAIIPFIYFCVRIEMEEVAILLCSVMGSLVGYLVFNMNPAKIFMGDTGALALGGLLAAVAMVTKEEIALILIGGVFVAEAVSVILQVGSFKLTGKRIFKMAPLHHHFELSGYSETEVVRMFWVAGLFLCIIGLLIGAYM